MGLYSSHGKLRTIGRTLGEVTLSGEEDKLITLGEELSKEDYIKERRSLQGNVCADRSIRKEILKVTMGKIWKKSKLMVFKAVGKNIFTVTFETESDKLRVMNDRS